MADEQVHIDGKSFPAHVLPIQRQIAEKMGTGSVRCDRCGRVQQLSVELVEKYLREGWPKCCEGLPDGGTMRYCRKEEFQP